MNILFFVDNELSGRGGMERMLSLYCRELMINHNVWIVLSKHSLDRNWENHLPVQSLNLPPPHQANQLILNTYINRISKIIYNTKYNVDCILSLGTASAKIAKLAVKAINSRATVISWLQLPLDHVIYDIGELAYADAHISITEGLRRDIERAIAGAKVKVVPHPVDFSNAIPVARARIPEFVYIGRLSKEKRVSDILMALSKHRDAEWILRIIGDGEELDKLQATAENCGISERVFFHGWSENPWELVKTCTAFVLSSEYESFGLVLVEALARGIPVISSDCPHGPKEIVNERNGWRYPVGDVDRLSSIMGDIINMRVPLPSIDSCIRSAKRFAKEIILPRFEDAIRQFAEQSLNNQALAAEES